SGISRRWSSDLLYTHVCGSDWCSVKAARCSSIINEKTNIIIDPPYVCHLSSVRPPSSITVIESAPSGKKRKELRGEGTFGRASSLPSSTEKVGGRLSSSGASGQNPCPSAEVLKCCEGED
ncbi:AGAP011222-PA, partial [Anopheles gambiae str. PEST]